MYSRSLRFTITVYLEMVQLDCFTDRRHQYSRVMGLETTLALVGNQFTNAASAFWIAVLLFEFPNSEHSAASWCNLKEG